MKAFAITVAAAGLGLSACATTATSQNAAIASATPDGAASLSVEEAKLSAIPDAKIPEKRCGMILWTLDEQRPTPVFRYVAEDAGVIALGGVVMELERTNIAGASGFGVFEQQRFTAANGLVVDIDARFGFGFDGGQYLESGLIRISSADGWRLVAPAAGIAGCR